MPELFVFGDFEVDEAACEVRLGGVPVKIQPKPFALLVHLVKNRHRVVDRNELLRTVWPGIKVSEQAFSSAVRDLRRALGDTNVAHRTILTVRGRGFRLAARVTAETKGNLAAPAHAGVDPVASSQGTLGPIELVEREDAMRTLRESQSAAQKGEARVSFIRGPAGIGKTRLANELVRNAEALGIDARVGRCSDGDGGTPFWPWLQIVRGSLTAPSIQELTPNVRATLAWIAPEFALGDVETRADLAGAEARFRVFDAMHLFLRRLSEARPLLLVLDDLQWADEASLLLLEFLLQALGRARIHLVGALRDAPRPNRTLSRVLEIATRDAAADLIDLKGLHRESVSRLLQLAGGKVPAATLTDAVHAATKGNPLFVVEIAKLVARGELDPSDAGRAIPVPKGVRDAIRWQLERLPPGCTPLLELASLVGREFEVMALSLAAGENQSVTLDRLGEAEAAGLIAPARERQASFTFVHDLVRESIYQDIPSPERARLHRRMAEALEELSRSDLERRAREIAYHYSAAIADGVALKALHFARLAGAQANSQMAFEDAVTHYDQALSALSVIPNHDPQTRCELLLAQAEAAWGTLEDAARVQARFVRAAEAARIAGSAELFARSALGRTGHGAGPGDFRDISMVDDLDIALLSEAKARLGTTPSELLALVLSRLALAVRYARGLAEADDLSREAMRIAEQLGVLSTLGAVLRFRHEVVSGHAFLGERTALAERILAVARAARSRPLELDAFFFLSRDHFEAGDFDSGFAFGRMGDALADTMRHPGALFRSGIRDVLVLTLNGSFEEAEQSARRFYERDAQRNMSANGTVGVQVAMIRMLRGEHSAAIEELERLQAHYPTVAWCGLALALERMRAGQPDAARRELDIALAEGFRNVREDHSSLGCYLFLADISWEFGDRRGAADLYELLRPYEQQIAGPFLCTLCQGSVARGLGTLAALLGHEDEAERHFRTALTTEEKLASPPLIALTLERYGAFLRNRGRSGDAKGAVVLLERASQLAENLGMKGSLRRCQKHLAGMHTSTADGPVRGQIDFSDENSAS